MRGRLPPLAASQPKPHVFPPCQPETNPTRVPVPLALGVMAKHASTCRTRLTCSRVGRMLDKLRGLSTFLGPEDADDRPHPDTPQRHRRNGRPGCDCGDYSGSWALRASTGTRPIPPSPEVRRGLRAFSLAGRVPPCGDHPGKARPLFWRSLRGVPNRPAPRTEPKKS